MGNTENEQKTKKEKKSPENKVDKVSEPKNVNSSESVKKKKILVVVLTSVLALAIIVVVLLVSLKSCSKPEEKIASLTVTTSVCDNINEKNWVRNDFSFNEKDISKKTDTTPAKIAIEVNEFVKQEYIIVNKTGHAINYSILLEETSMDNCELTYTVDDGEVLNLTNQIVGQVEANQESKIAIFIRIKDIGQIASFDSKFYFTLTI